MNSDNYWNQRSAAVFEEYEQTIQCLRNEVQQLQGQVTDLLHERSLMKAATANDVRSFCLNYQASAAAGGTGTASSSASFSSSTSPSYSVNPMNQYGPGDSIPVYDLLMFLHRYSNGLVPPPENKRKRVRTNSAGSVGNSRLFQRMLTRQRCTGREGETEEYSYVAQQQQQQQLQQQQQEPY